MGKAEVDPDAIGRGLFWITVLSAIAFAVAAYVIVS